MYKEDLLNIRFIGGYMTTHPFFLINETNCIGIYSCETRNYPPAMLG